MIIKLSAGLVAIALVIAYLVPPIYKLKEIELGVVVLIGIALMLVDLVHSMRKED
jgi:hypothetical protein